MREIERQQIEENNTFILDTAIHTMLLSEKNHYNHVNNTKQTHRQILATLFTGTRR